VFVETDGDGVDIKGWKGRQLSIQLPSLHADTPGDTKSTKLTKLTKETP
jgi:hypothetical protein